MTQQDKEPWLQSLDSTQHAVDAFANIEFEKLVRKLIWHLQRMPAAGLYGDAYNYKTLWDEYCHEVQEGPHDIALVDGWRTVSDSWAQQLAPLVIEIADQVPRHVAQLLSGFAATELEEEEDWSFAGSYWPEGIRGLLVKRLQTRASERNLHRLGPWRNSE